MNDDTAPHPGDGSPRPTLHEIDADRCHELLASRPVGRLAFVDDDGQPLILPVNHVVHEGAVHIKTMAGAKLAAAERRAGSKVAFEVDDHDERGRGWSVVVRGTLHEVLDAVANAKLDRLDHHTWADDVERRRWLRIGIDEITGRRIDGDEEIDD